MQQIEKILNFKPFNAIELKAAQLLQNDKMIIVMARNEEKIGNLEERACKNAIYALVAQTIELSGENKKDAYDTNVIKNVTKFLYDWLIDKYRGATISELKLAFNFGVAKEYGDYVGYGVATFTKFFKGYMDSVRRSSAMKEWGHQEDVVRQMPDYNSKPVTEIFRLNKELAEHLLSMWSETLSKHIKTTVYTAKDDTVFHLPSLYDFIRTNYGTNFTEQTKAEILKNAKVSYSNFITGSGIKESDKKSFDLIVQTVKMGDNKSFDYHCKTEALKVIYNWLKKDNNTLDALNTNPTI